jgi:hypothetical protein
MGIFNLVGNWIKNVFTFGGEKYTGSALEAGIPENTIDQRLQTKFGETTQSDLALTRDFGRAGVDFGTELTARLGESGIDLSGAPVNPFLFGDDPAGNRFFWRGRVYVDELGRWVHIDVIAPDFVSGEQLREEFINEALRRITSSPRGFGIPPGETPTILDVQIIFGERRF